MTPGQQTEANAQAGASVPTSQAVPSNFQQDDAVQGSSGCGRDAGSDTGRALSVRGRRYVLGLVGVAGLSLVVLVTGAVQFRQGHVSPPLHSPSDVVTPAAFPVVNEFRVTEAGGDLSASVPMAPTMSVSVSGIEDHQDSVEQTSDELAPDDVVTPTLEDSMVTSSPQFDGRPLRRLRTIQMEVTAYAPDYRSCGPWADGMTASGFSVWTNGMRLVAADTSLLPFGTILSVPGYHGGQPVQVLDIGGRIKGRRLDVMMPTHREALVWGRQSVAVDVWAYDDDVDETHRVGRSTIAVD